MKLILICVLWSLCVRASSAIKVYSVQNDWDFMQVYSHAQTLSIFLGEDCLVIDENSTNVAFFWNPNPGGTDIPCMKKHVDRHLYGKGEIFSDIFEHAKKNLLPHSQSIRRACLLRGEVVVKPSLSVTGFVGYALLFFIGALLIRALFLKVYHFYKGIYGMFVKPKKEN
jgi:hypothetical protein